MILLQRIEDTSGSIVDISNKSILEEQVSYDSLACCGFATETAQKWCMGRILSTNASGLITATQSRNFNGLTITVRTY